MIKFMFEAGVQRRGQTLSSDEKVAIAQVPKEWT